MILLISPKQVYATKRLAEEAKKAKVGLGVFDVNDLSKKNFRVDVNKYQTLFIRQGWPYEKQIIALAKKFHRAGKKVVDEAIVKGELGQGKRVDYLKLKKAGLPIPKTASLIHNPLSFTYPLILKWNYGFRGRGVFLINNQNQFKSILQKYPKEELLLQEFIPAQYEYKVITIGFKSLPVVLRFNIDLKTKRPDFGSAKTIKSQNLLMLINLAGKASRMLKRELAKVDILQKDNHFYILEVNRWPGLKSFEQLTKYNAAKEFIRYLFKASCLNNGF